MLIAVSAPLIAGNQPIACHFDGQWHFPALVDVANKIPFLSFVLNKSKPFRFAGFDAKTAVGDDESAIWPVVRYGPLETTSDGLARPSREHWLGTDEVGRDLLARLVHGAVVSVKVGVVSMGIAAVLGVLLGGAAGYFGGWTDALISRLIEVVMCFPVFFLILSIMVWIEPDINNVMVVIGLTRWTGIARYTRAEFLRLKSQDFVAAAVVSGAGPLRIMLRHLLPNAMSPLWGTIAFGMAQAVLTEAGLSWLGFGVQWPEPSWGNLLRSAFEHRGVAPAMIAGPSVAILLTVLAYNLVGDALRDATDPKRAATP
ncbi:MAG: ABC transporter permease [Phycisphaerales bacterium]|nr:ABC transporter permease [Phycisphaerales bacterium]